MSNLKQNKAMQTNEIKTEVVLITPKLAQEILKNNHVNRRLNKNLVKFYAYQMRSNQWKLTGQGITIDRNGNLQDGQHRLHAIIECDIAIKFLLITGTEPDCNINYDHGKTRSAADAMQIIGIENSVRYSSQIRNYLSRIKTKSYSKYSSNDGRSSYDECISVQDIIDVFETTPLLWSDIAVVAERCRKNLNIINESVLGGIMGYLIIEKNHDFNFVKSFLLQLHGIDPDKYEITRALRKVLMRDKLALKKLPPVTKTAYIHKTWNHYVKGGNIKNLVFNSEIEKVPELI